MRASSGAIVRDVLYGALVTTVCTFFAFILALGGFGRLYYVAVFLPFFMLACLLVAWFLYLKDDGFIRSGKIAGASAAVTDRHGSRPTTGDLTADNSLASGPTRDSPADGRPDLSMYAPKGNELVPRRSDGLFGHWNATGASRPGEGEPGVKESGGDGNPAGAMRALLWAAVQLGLLAAALYSWAGVGAGYFVPVVP